MVRKKVQDGHVHVYDLEEEFEEAGGFEVSGGDSKPNSSSSEEERFMEGSGGAGSRSTVTCNSSPMLRENAPGNRVPSTCNCPYQ